LLTQTAEPADIPLQIGVKSKKMTFYAIKDIPPKKPAEGVEMRVIHGERMTLAFFTIASGSGVPEHQHPHEQIGTVLKGKLELMISGEKRIVSSGGAYIIPPNAIHSGLCREGPAEVIEIFAPVREDWLQR
jgi:quercetin dioxygenase-like cupin family protein